MIGVHKRAFAITHPEYESTHGNNAAVAIALDYSVIP
jgi:hypothetical protein